MNKTLSKHIPQDLQTQLIMKRYLLFFTLLFSLNLQAQQTVTCGVTSNICYPLDCISAYTDNQNYIETYSSSDGVSNLKIEFTSFDVEDSFDFLYIYDAASTDPNKLVATYTGLTLPTSISSTGTSLTLQFVSDGSVTQQGFKAKLECLGNQAPTVTSLSPSNSSNNNAGSADLIIDFNEVVNPVAGKFITIKNAGTNATIEQIDASSANVTGGGTKKINIHPSTNLADGFYYILIDAGAFQDIANADFAGFSNTNDWAFDIRNVTFDGFAGKAAQFKETLGQPATYAEVLDNSAFDLQDEFTIEFWTKIDKLKQDQKIIGKVNDGASKGYLIGFTDGKLFCEFWDTQGKISQLKGGVIEENKWIHVAVTWKKSDGNVIAYLNGVEVGSVGNLTDSWGTNSNSLIIGGDSRNTNQFKLDGKMDEIRIWSESRTSKEIRENIYLTLTGQEYGLISYWQCNDTDNTILRDEKGLFHASLKNGATKVNSTLPVGAGLSETHTVQSGIGIIEDFTTVDLELNIEIYDNIFGTGDIVVSKINGDPNPILTNVITPYSINYWIVRLYGGGNIDASPTFKLNNFITNTDKTPDLSLFKRGSNSDLEWGFVDEGRFISFANQQIGFGDYIDYNMQFAISRGNARQIDSLALVALYNATDGGS